MKTKTLIVGLSILIIAFISSICTVTDTTLGTGSLQGTVYNESTGLPMDAVTITVSGKSSMTAADGTFQITDITDGLREVTVYKSTYKQILSYVDIITGDMTVRDFFLQVDNNFSTTTLTTVSPTTILTTTTVITTTTVFTGTTSTTTVVTGTTTSTTTTSVTTSSTSLTTTETSTTTT